MIVCHCKGITDRDIRDAVRSGAATRTDVSRACDAGGGCMGCHPLIDRILGEEEQPTATADVRPALESHAY